MKHTFQYNSIIRVLALIMGLFFGSVTTQAQSPNFSSSHFTCLDTFSGIAPNAPVGNVFTPNGGSFTPKGRLNILIVPVRYGDSIDANINVSSWSHLDTLPSVLFSGTLFYEDQAQCGSYQNQDNLSDYFYSFSHPNAPFIVTATVFPHVVIAPLPSNNPLSIYASNRAAFYTMDSLEPNFPWHKFDLRTSRNRFDRDNSNDGPDGLLDLVVFVHRNNRGFAISTGASRNDTIVSALDGKTYAMYDSYTMMQFTNNPLGFFNTFTHEFSHVNYGTPHISGANNTHGYHFKCEHFYGMMDIGGTGFSTPNAWERWYRGWLVHDPEVTPQNIPPAGQMFILKDHATQSSALRIQIPNSNHTQAGGHDYLWLENHQMISPFDRKKRYLLPNAEQMVPGLYAYTVDAGGMDRHNPIGSYLNNQGDSRNSNLIQPLSGDGKWDWTWAGDSVPDPYTATWPGGQRHLKVWEKVRENPIGGGTFRQRIPFDKNADNTLRLSIFRGGSGEQGAEQISNAAGPVNGSNIDHWRYTGSGISAFLPGDEISLSGIQPALNYPEYYDLQGKNARTGYAPETWEPYYLNGLQVYFLGYTPNGEAKIWVKYTDFELRNDKRWTGEIILPDLDSSSTTDKLKIAANKTVTLAQMGNPNRESLDSTSQDFVSPSRLSIEAGGYLQLGSNARFIVSENSTLRLHTGSKLEIQALAQLIVRSGATLQLEDASDLEVSYLGRVHIEAGGKILIKGRPQITLEGPGGVLEIDGQMEIADNSTFTFVGNALGTGHVIWGVPAGASPIICGNHAGIELVGLNAQDHILSIKDNCALKPATNLATFRMEKGQLKMGQNAWIGTATADLFFKDLQIEASNVAQPWKTIYINGQSSHVLAFLDISGAQTGLTARQFYGNGAVLQLSDSRISACGTGLQVYSSGVNLIDCTLELNNAGMRHDLPTRPSRLQSCRFLNNVQDGLKVVQAAADYRVENSQADQNGRDGIVFSGPASLIPTCGSVSQNGQVGIRLGLDATLFMDNSVEQSGANMRIAGNQVSVLLQHARNIHLYSGRNDLMSAPFWGGQRDLYGNLLANNTSAWTKPGAYNHWNNRSVACLGVSPVYGTDNIVQDLNGNPILFSDFSRHCPPGQCLSGNPGNGQTFAMQLGPGVPDCGVLNTAHYVGSGLKIAVWDASSEMEGLGGKDDLLALEKFNEILSFSGGLCADARYLELAYVRMRACLLNACASGKVQLGTGGVLPAEIQQFIAVQTARAEQQTALYAKNLQGMDRAFTYHRAGQNGLALAGLQAISQYDSSLGMVVQDARAYSVCMIGVQEQVLDGTLALADFELALGSCLGSGKRAEAVSLAAELDLLAGSAARYLAEGELDLRVYPIPAREVLRLGWNGLGNAGAEIVIFDLQGKMVMKNWVKPNVFQTEMDLGGLANGVYWLRLRSGSGMVSRKIVVQ